MSSLVGAVMRLSLPATFLALVIGGFTPVGSAGNADVDEAREMMLEMVRESARVTGSQTGVETIDPRVLTAMGRVPRHEFVPAELRPAAYLNMPLPVAKDATVSQPFIVALMLHLVQVQPDDQALVIGVGGGYQTALLAELAREVKAVEITEEVAELARGTLARLGYEQIELRVDDGFYGWPERREFDVIVMRMSVPYVPPPLLAQLRPGGRMVVPVGRPEGQQQLTVIEKDANGGITERQVLEVRFTPLPGGIRT